MLLAISLPISHAILLGICGFIILYLLIVLAEKLISKYTRITTSLTYAESFSPFAWIIIILLVTIGLTWVHIGDTRITPKVSYHTIYSEESLIEFSRMDEVIYSYFRNKQDQENKGKKYHRGEYRIDDWKGKKVRANQPVDVIGVSHSGGRLYVELPDGSRGYSYNVQLTPEQIDSIYECELAYNYGYLISRDRFNELILNKTIDQIDPDKRYRVEVAQVNGEWFAMMAFKVFDDNIGKFFYPVLICDKNKVIQDYRRIELKTHGNAWILKRIPFAAWVFDQPWITWIANKHLYKNYEVKDILPNGGILMFLLKLAIGIIYCIIVAYWFVLLNSIPLLILTLLIRFRYIYYVFSNKVLTWVLGVLGFIGAHCISVIMLEDFSWVYYVIISISGFGAAVLLLMHIISCRCDHCRYVLCKDLITKKLVNEYDTDYYDKSEYVGVIGSRTETWTEEITETTRITDQYDNTLSSSSSTRYEDHSRTYETLKYDDYIQKDHVQEFDLTWKCRHCRDISHTKDSNRWVTERIKVGSHIRRRIS